MDNLGEIIIYQTEDGLTKLDVRMEDETVWLTQQDLMPKQRMAEISHLQAYGYLIYTLLTPFDFGEMRPRKERIKDMIKVLFVCWGKRFQ